MAWNFDDFKTARRWNGFNRFLQVLLSITLVLAMNYLASQSSMHQRWDIGTGSHQTLSLEAQKYLESIGRRAPQATSEQKPWVTVYLTLSDAGWALDEQVNLVNMLRRQLDHLLDDISYAAAKTPPTGWLRIERADRMKNAGVWANLLSQYPEIREDTALVVVCSGRYRVIKVDDLFHVRQRGADDIDTGFKGEEVLVSALLSVTNEKPPAVYLTTGHGEMAANDTGLRGLASLDLKLRARNIALRALDLTKVNDVPTDAALVLIAGPQTAFSPEETEKLRRYMRERNGRLIALIGVGIKDGLDDLFYDWGILVDDARIWDTSPESIDSKGNMLLHIGGRPHDLTRLLAGRGMLATTQARPVRFDVGSPIDDTLQVTELAYTDANKAFAWGERDYLRQPYENNPDRGDIPAPVSGVAVAERAAGLRLNLKIPGGRMLVAGAPDIISNAFINSATNEHFLLNAVNWMLDREQLLNVPPRPLPDFYLREVTRSDLSRVAWRFILLPGGVLLIGLGVFFWRRST